MTDGAKLHYKTLGRGTPLLFIHGWLFNSGIWKYQLEHFKKQFHVISVDLRGFGKSEIGKAKPSLEQFVFDIEQLLKELSLHNVNIVGWSMGGFIAMKLALFCPERLKSLTLVSTTPSLIQRDGFPQALPPVIVNRIKTQIARTPKKTMENFQELIFSPEEKKLNTINTLKKILIHESNESVECLENSLDSFMKEDLRSSLHKISLPALIIHGNKDCICMPEAALFLKEKLKRASLYLLKECGHAPFLTLPYQFNKILTSFLSSL